MLQGFYYQDINEGPNLELKYPSRAKHPRELLTVKDRHHADRVWNIRTRKYIFETLRSWVLQRKHAINAAENHFKSSVKQKNDAIERLLLCLMSHYESQLPMLARRVGQHKKDIDLISPSANSRFLNHYEEVISPIIEWCEDYTKQLNEAKKVN